MSTLRVNNLTAVGGTGTITVPTGNQVVQKGAILQVVQGIKRDTFSASSGTSGAGVAITGLSASITPTSSSSKILVMASVAAGGGGHIYLTLRRGSSAITDATGNADGSAQRTTSIGAATDTTQQTIVYLDSPATTSSITYDIFISNSGTGFGLSVNRNGTGTAATDGRQVSTITVMEVAG